MLLKALPPKSIAPKSDHAQGRYLYPRFTLKYVWVIKSTTPRTRIPPLSLDYPDLSIEPRILVAFKKHTQY